MRDHRHLSCAWGHKLGHTNPDVASAVPREGQRSLPSAFITQLELQRTFGDDPRQPGIHQTGTLSPEQGLEARSPSYQPGALTAEPPRPTSGPREDDSEGASTGEQLPGPWGEVWRWTETKNQD